jgi:phosphonate transport system ATP-binding protein
VYKGTREDIRKMTDGEFKDIYGEDAERIGAGLEGTLSEGSR